MEARLQSPKEGVAAGGGRELALALGCLLWLALVEVGRSMLPL